MSGNLGSVRNSSGEEAQSAASDSHRILPHYTKYQHVCMWWHHSVSAHVIGHNQGCGAGAGHFAWSRSSN